jgi:hypothetical protein
MQKMVEFDNSTAIAALPVAAAPGGGADGLSGDWKWHGKNASFTADGKATVEGLGSGSWLPANPSNGTFALVLHDSAGRASKNQIMLGQISQSDPATIHIADLAGKKYDVTKKAGP